MIRTELQELIDESAYCWQSNRMDEAIKACNKALAIDPDCVGAISNLGATYWAQGKPKEALPWLLKGHELDNTNLQTIQNVATIYQDLGDIDNAIAFYEKAIELMPRNAYYRWCKGTCLLAKGDYVKGWAYYEEGLGQPGIRGAPPKFRTGQWNGEYCNRLVMWHEQGFGDTLQFIRYARLAKEIVNKVIVLAPKPLHRVLGSCPWVDDVVETINEGEFEQHISIMSMPWLMRTTLEKIPSEVPYLFSNKRANDVWKPRMPDTKLKVGLVWAGNPRKHEIKFRVIDGRRTVTLDMMKPILDVENIDFYALQKGGEAEAQQYDDYLTYGTSKPKYANLTNFMPEVVDFADTAAIVANLDLVITVDTAMAHLVGAMGKPVWIPSRFDACWRWLQNRPSNPWYPTARVFGQTEPGNWTSVIQQVADLLKTARIKE